MGIQIVVSIHVENVNDLEEQQINDQTLHNEVIVNEHVIDKSHEIALRRSMRERRSAISNDYMVYLT